MSKNRPGRLIIVSAPSGAGKGTVLSRLRELRPEIAYSVSATTRPPREGEVHGREYLFVSQETFGEMQERDEFLECETYVGNRYGTPIGPIKKNIENGVDTILEIEIQGARAVKAKIPDALMLFIMPPSTEELRRRLEGRGAIADNDLYERLSVAEEEMAAASEYDYVIINDDVRRTALEIIEIIDGNAV